MNGLSGWVKIHRKILDDPLWAQMPCAYFRVAFVMLVKANHAPRKWFDGRVEVLIPRGALITSRPSMCADARVTPRQYRDAMACLEQVGYLTSKRTNRYTTVTITNYEGYQGPAKKDQKRTSKRTSRNTVITPTNHEGYQGEPEKKDQQKDHKRTTPEEDKKLGVVEHAAAAKKVGSSGNTAEKTPRVFLTEAWPKTIQALGERGTRRPENFLAAKVLPLALEVRPDMTDAFLARAVGICWKDGARAGLLMDVMLPYLERGVPDNWDLPANWDASKQATYERLMRK